LACSTTSCNQATILNDGLLALEQDAQPEKQLEALMRAAHSIKGAARMVDIDTAVKLAHAMEDCFVAAQQGELHLQPQQIDLLLKGVDQLLAISTQQADAEELSTLTQQIQTIEQLKPVEEADIPQPATAVEPATGEAMHSSADDPDGMAAQPEAAQQDAEAAIETPVPPASTNSENTSGNVLQIKHRQAELIGLLDRLNENLDANGSIEYSKTLASEIQSKANRCRHQFSERLVELDEYERRTLSLGKRLHEEVITSRMRPFSDVTRGFPRMIRDVARQLGKQVDFRVDGLATQVDRDILDRIEAPLNHLLRNALDHGIETVEERRQAGKPEQATLRLTAAHSSGMLSIRVEDDGRGIELEKLRKSIIAKGMVNETMATEMSETELLEFLFLPGFSTRDEVTEISGRGVGLDIVHSTVQQMRGVVRASSSAGAGTQFHLQLPLTLSVIRALLVEIGGEPYAIPLSRIDRTLRLDTSQLESLEGRQYFTLGTQHVGLVFASQVLDCSGGPGNSDFLPVVVLGERLHLSGLVVDRFIGERNLVVHTIDPRLGKIQDISAASLLENGDPCLIIDVDDLLRSIDILIAGGRLNRIYDKQDKPAAHIKRILVVDDSITVREVERNMLVTRGYHVDVAVDGMDGWNAVRMDDYDLVISDVDMPRMNGFEFVRLIRQDERLSKTPVMIVSYKDREEDRQRGLEAGADYYLTKGSFHDETLIEAVLDLIGTAE